VFRWGSDLPLPRVSQSRAGTSGRPESARGVACHAWVVTVRVSRGTATMLAAVAVSVAAAAPAAGRALSPSARRSSTSAVTFAGKACINARAVPAVATFLHSGEGLHLTIGAVVWVVLVGPASWPASPWLTPTSSNTSVLRSVPFCTSIYPASAPLNWTVFRALRPGRAVVNAPLTPGLDDPQYAPYRAVVHVARA